ncbi:MAG: heavy metal translocating P-type ATPase [Pseudomonadota bacterium]
MLPLIPIVLSGVVIVSALGLRKNYQSQHRQLISDDNQVVDNPKTPKKHSLKRRSLSALLAIEATYQSKIQKYIDPLFGQTRHQHLQEFASTELRKLSPEERIANIWLGVGSIVVTSALISTFIYPPFMGVALLFGLSELSSFYYTSYLELKRTRCLGSIHLLCIYDGFMWLGGFATVGSVGILFLGVGLKIKAMTENRAQQHLSQIFQLQPDTVWVRIDGVEVEIPFAQLAIGDTLVLHSGQIVPVDGTVIGGEALVDQHVLTGESQPVEIRLSDQVFASTRAISGNIDVRVDKTGSETTAGRLGTILKETAKYNVSTTLKVIEVGDRYTWPTLAFSTLSIPFIGPAGAICILGANYTFNIRVTGSVAVLNFLNTASENAVLIKDFKALEELNNIDLIIFDKTGTLTVEQPAVGRIHSYANYSEAQILAFAAAAEMRQNHPIASAILAATETADLTIPATQNTHYALGLGIKVKLVAEQKTLRVGSVRFLQQENITLPTQFACLSQACATEGYSLVMVALDNICIGAIELHPNMRSETPQIIEQLQQQGLELCIISGDQTTPTQKLAEQLGIERYFANVLPEGKAELVERFQQEGRRVCFIGDGINDAIAMQKAEVSISLCGATTAATDIAQIILMDGSLRKLPKLFGLAQTFERRLAQNLYMTSGFSVLTLMGIFLGGFSFLATESLRFVSTISALTAAMQPVRHSLNDEKKLKTLGACSQ